MTQAGYAPTVAEKKPLITSEKPLLMGTVFGYVSSSRTIQVTIVQKMIQFRKRRGIGPLSGAPGRLPRRLR